MTHQQRFRIMIVEDNRADVYLLKQALHKAGLDFTAIVFEDGESAFRYIDSEAESEIVPDVAILDLNVPKRDGSEVLAYIRCNPRFRHMAVVVLSSSPTRVMHEQAGEADCYITKPSELDEFLRIGKEIRNCVEAIRVTRMPAFSEQILQPA